MLHSFGLALPVKISSSHQLHVQSQLASPCQTITGDIWVELQLCGPKAYKTDGEHPFSHTHTHTHIHTPFLDAVCESGNQTKYLSNSKWQLCRFRTHFLQPLFSLRLLHVFLPTSCRVFIFSSPIFGNFFSK